MNKPYRLIVFDWEGTLGDTLGKIIKLLKSEAQRLKLGEVNETVARKYLMLGLVVAIKKLFPDLPEEKSESLMNAVRESSAARSMDAYLLPGARTLIETLKHAGMDLAIATNKSQSSLQRDLYTTDLGKYFTITRSAGQFPAKPCPQMLEDIMDVCGVTPYETLMIGDATSDIEMASALQVDAVGVNFYSQPELTEELLSAGALVVFDDYQKLMDYLRSN